MFPEAPKKYGMILADDASDMFVGGTYGIRWDDETPHSPKRVTAGDFEAVGTGRAADGPRAWGRAKSRRPDVFRSAILLGDRGPTPADSRSGPRSLSPRGPMSPCVPIGCPETDPNEATRRSNRPT